MMMRMNVIVFMFMRMFVAMFMLVFVCVIVAVFVCVRQFVGVAEAVFGDGDFDAVNAATRDIIGADVPVFDGQRSQIGAEFIERRAAIEQSGQSHIARDAAETIEIRNFHFC